MITLVYLKIWFWNSDYTVIIKTVFGGQPLLGWTETSGLAQFLVMAGFYSLSLTSPHSGPGHTARCLLNHLGFFFPMLWSLCSGLLFSHLPPAHLSPVKWLNPTVLQRLPRGSPVPKTWWAPGKVRRPACVPRMPRASPLRVHLCQTTATLPTPWGRSLRLPHGPCYPWDTWIHQDACPE